MSQPATLVFRADGMAIGLYTEVVDLSSLGRLRIKRATRIEFDDARQVWRVKDRRGFALYTSPSRQACLDWERKYFDAKLERMG